MPAISIIVPVYNVEKYLDECLRSIEEQTFSDLEIICVNDGSTDSSLEVLKEHQARDERILIVDKPNAGYGHSINMGLSRATGSYIGIVESDDFIEPEMYEKLYERATTHDLDIARVNYWLYWSKPAERNEFFEAYREDACGIVFNPRDMPQSFFFPPALWAMLVRRSLIVENDLRLLETPGASYQDTSFSFKLWACAEKAELIHAPYLHYRQDNESSSINNKQKANQVCTEYKEIERFILEGNQDMGLMPIMQRRKYDAYMWNMSRIDESLRPEFAEVFSTEFEKARDNKWLSKEFFSNDEWETLMLGIENPISLVRLQIGEEKTPKSLVERILHKVFG